MSARRPRTRHERIPARCQLCAGLSCGIGKHAPVHPEDSALLKALTEGITGPGKDPADDDCQARTGIRADGLPAGHPESMVLGGLSPADEVGLAALSNDLWPDDEYADITAGDYGERWDWGGAR